MTFAGMAENGQEKLTMWGTEVGAVISVPVEELSPLGGWPAMSGISDVLLHFCYKRNDKKCM